MARPAEANAVYMSSTRLDIEVNPDGLGERSRVRVQGLKAVKCLRESWTDKEVPDGLVIVSAGSHVALEAAEVGEDYRALVPLSHDCARGEGRNNLDAGGGREKRPAPLEHTPVTGQRPEC